MKAFTPTVLPFCPVHCRHVVVVQYHLKQSAIWAHTHKVKDYNLLVSMEMWATVFSRSSSVEVFFWRTLLHCCSNHMTSYQTTVFDCYQWKCLCNVVDLNTHTLSFLCLCCFAARSRPGEEAERLWKQKAAWNSDSVRECHSGLFVLFFFLPSQMEIICSVFTQINSAEVWLNWDPPEMKYATPHILNLKYGSAWVSYRPSLALK